VLSFTALPGIRLDKFLSQMLPDHSRSKLVKMIDDGGVLVNGKPEKSAYKLRAGEVVELEAPADTEAHDLTPHAMEIEVVYEDDDLLIVNKPRGLASHPAASLKEPSLVNVLLARGGPLSELGGEFRPGIVHRLDKETTGLMVVAKNDIAHASLAAQIEKKDAERRYFAVVAGEIDRERFTIDAPMARNASYRLQMTVDPKGKPAVTHIKRIVRLHQGTLIACRLETGRTHQIRVHLRALGYPVIGDDLYAPKEYKTGAMQLHAAYLAVVHPKTGQEIVAFANAPEDFLGSKQAIQSAIDPF
jgi:23S rRNA pseudouridine1911/1915/1917 synthase